MALTLYSDIPGDMLAIAPSVFVRSAVQFLGKRGVLWSRLARAFVNSYLSISLFRLG